MISLLTDRFGPDGFHYFMPISGSATLPGGAQVLANDDDGDLIEALY